MMSVTVRGESPAVDAGEWRRATAWYMSEIVGPRMAAKIGLTIELIPYIRGKCGSTACSDWRKPRNFVVQIETGKASRRKQLSTLAHELVHVGQAVRGDLKVRNGEIYWRRSFSVPPAFSDEPWEEEAYRRERWLFTRYEAHKNGLPSGIEHFPLFKV